MTRRTSSRLTLWLLLVAAAAVMAASALWVHQVVVTHAATESLTFRDVPVVHRRLRVLTESGYSSPMDAFHETYDSVPHRRLILRSPESSVSAVWRRMVGSVPRLESSRWGRRALFHSTTPLTLATTDASTAATQSPMDAYDMATTTRPTFIGATVRSTIDSTMTSSDEYFVRDEHVSTRRRLTQIHRRPNVARTTLLRRLDGTTTATPTMPPRHEIWCAHVVEWVRTRHWTTLVVVLGCGSLALLATCLAACCCLWDLVACLRRRRNVAPHAMEAHKSLSRLDETEPSTDDESEAGGTWSTEQALPPTVDSILYHRSTHAKNEPAKQTRTRRHPWDTSNNGTVGPTPAWSGAPESERSHHIGTRPAVPLECIPETTTDPSSDPHDGTHHTPAPTMSQSTRDAASIDSVTTYASCCQSTTSSTTAVSMASSTSPLWLFATDDVEMSSRHVSGRDPTSHVRSAHQREAWDEFTNTVLAVVEPGGSSALTLTPSIPRTRTADDMVEI